MKHYPNDIMATAATAAIEEYLEKRGTPLPQGHDLRAFVWSAVNATSLLPFNGLTPAECELLDLLAEECAEVILAIGKIKRHGWESTNPLGPGPTNRRALEWELGCVDAAKRLLAKAGHIDTSVIARRSEQKQTGVMRWMHHQGAK